MFFMTRRRYYHLSKVSAIFDTRLNVFMVDCGTCGVFQVALMLVRDHDEMALTSANFSLVSCSFRDRRRYQHGGNGGRVRQRTAAIEGIS